MKKEVEITLLPEDKDNASEILSQIARTLKTSKESISGFTILRRSLDARSKHPIYRSVYQVGIGEEIENKPPIVEYKEVTGNKKVVIIGGGPAGMFAALRLLEYGIKPIILERGKDVRGRRRDLRAIMQFDEVNPNSNYCFGEGGAGTYSDGKLYTRSTKRGDIKRALAVLVQHGALEEILYEAHPHIGSNKLPKIVEQIRNTIISHGGEVRFENKVTDFIISDSQMQGVVVNDATEVLADAVIVATGHSARDIFFLLDKRGVAIEAKPFALGVRIEHPQQFIDQARYHSPLRNPHLPAASYSLTCQVAQRGVFSFCMCPGGIIVPAATAPGEIVVNGMSVSKRDSPFANSGFVVQITEQELQPYSKHGVFAALAMQQEVEQKAFRVAGGTQTAPAQRVTDLLKGKVSSSLPKTSYIPGITSVDMKDVLPEFVYTGIKEALKVFDKQIRGYVQEEAIVVAPESRTSSPIRIPREKETYEHISIKNLYPSGEGAGYAGGILSAAMDGENVAEAIVKKLS